MRGAKKETERSSLMHVGRRVDYAVRALAYLAAQPPGILVPKQEITKNQDIPPHFLSKIMRELVVRGLVESRIGLKGGFRLARPGATISMREVYEAVEGPLSVMECIEHGESYCWFSPVCAQISIWARAQSLLASYLATVSIADIADQQGLKRRLSNLRRARSP